MAENIWNWFLRLLLTIVLLLVISILGLVAYNLPDVFDTIEDVGRSAQRAASSVTETSERAYDALEEMSEQQR